MTDIGLLVAADEIAIEHMVTTFKYVEGGPDRKAPEVIWNTSSYM